MSLPSWLTQLFPLQFTLKHRPARRSVQAFRLFAVTATGSLTLENLTLQNGVAQGSAGANPGDGGAAGMGGAIFNAGSLTISNTTFVGNQAIGGNGAAGCAAGSGANG